MARDEIGEGIVGVGLADEEPSENRSRVPMSTKPVIAVGNGESSALFADIYKGDFEQEWRTCSTFSTRKSGGTFTMDVSLHCSG